MYYENLIERTNIDATTDMLRSYIAPVLEADVLYNKAEKWRKSTGAGIDVGDDSTIKEKLSQISTNYEHFSVLFGSKSEANCVIETYNLDVLQYCSHFTEIVEVAEIAAELSQ
ncbi:uncharacterized protein LOC120780650 [Bactrocera tryoni]|uniref:uncharacterized protein LOC120780650 n=1 Tax=Bactrocera tryoni TaxID=59916 RepID=UPI001A9725BB|nr:uncharacterized protein LOC120780650 [Bactrocera tryoni]